MNKNLNNNSLQNFIAQAKADAQNLLTNFASSENFLTDIDTAFGGNYIQLNLEQFYQQWKENNFTDFPEIEIRSAAEINGANGAFSADTNKIYLAKEFLNRSNSQAVTDLLLEEYGHFVDSRINASDAPGDEGAIFAALVQGEKIVDSELHQLKTEDDSTVVILDGEEIAIEQNQGVEICSRRPTEESDYDRSRGSVSYFQGRFTNVIIGDTETSTGHHPGCGILTPKNDFIDGLGGDDHIIGLDGDDTLIGGSGDDRLEVSYFNISSYSVAYLNIFSVPVLNENINGSYEKLRTNIPLGGGNNLLIGGEGDDTLRSGIGNDTLRGGAGDDQTYGNSGNSLAEGNEGNDTLRGGIADDTLLGGEGDDEIFDFNGNNLIQGNEGDDYIDAWSRSNTTFSGFSEDRIGDYSGDNLIEGNEGNDTIRGSLGNDTLRGGEGDDYIDAHSGNNLIEGNEGNDTLIGSFSNDGNDTIIGGEGDDRIFDFFGDNLIEGNDGDDYIDGSFGKDTIFGGEGDDEISDISGNNLIEGNEGNDTLAGSDENDTILGGKGDDVYRVFSNFITSSVGGTVIEDSAGNDEFHVFNFGGSAEIKPFLESGSVGVERDGTTLLVDINRDGIADSQNDVSILNFFLNKDTSEVGTGYIENIPYLFAVNTTGDEADPTPGDGNIDVDPTKPGQQITLRSLIDYANNNPGLDEIRFDIPTSDSGYDSSTGTYAINIQSALPIISDAIDIDGQNNIELKGNGGKFVGLNITAGNSTVQNLTINNFGGAGILLEDKGNNTVDNNYIGTNVSGTQAIGNLGDGILVQSSNNTIKNNLISGNGNSVNKTGSGISITGNIPTGNLIENNLIGTNATGNQALGNVVNGIFISDKGGNTVKDNVISGNVDDGIDIRNATNNIIKGNKIGTDINGNQDLGNGERGINIEGNDNKVGGSNPNLDGNIIAFNKKAGVAISSGTGNTIFGNSIFENAGLGIDLGNDGTTNNDPGDADTGANNLQNAPSIFFVGEEEDNNGNKNKIVTVHLNSTPQTEFLIQLFAENGEPLEQNFQKAVITDDNGNTNYKIPVSLETENIRGTAINLSTRDTSEISFSQTIKFDKDLYELEEGDTDLPLNIFRSGLDSSREVTGEIVGIPLLEVLEQKAKAGGLKNAEIATNITEAFLKEMTDLIFSVPSAVFPKKLPSKIIGILGNVLIPFDVLNTGLRQASLDPDGVSAPITFLPGSKSEAYTLNFLQNKEIQGDSALGLKIIIPDSVKIPDSTTISNFQPLVVVEDDDINELNISFNQKDLLDITETALLAAITGAALGAAGGPLGAVVGAVVGAARGVVVGELQEAATDIVQKGIIEAAINGFNNNSNSANKFSFLTEESETLIGSEASDNFMGNLAELNGDVIFGFTSNDIIQIEGASLTSENVTVTLGSAILDIDADLDGIIDSTITLKGDFTDVDFIVEPISVEGFSTTFISIDDSITDNSAPIAIDDEVITDRDTTVVVDVVANDTDVDGDALFVSSFDATSTMGGSISLDDNDTPADTTDDRLVYTPAAGFSGTDNFTYQVSDGTDTATANVEVTVNPPVNNPPQATDDAATTEADTAINISVLANDTDADGDSLSLDSFDTTNTRGTVIDKGDGTFDYDPNGQFNNLKDVETASDSFTYTISDGNGGEDTATVNITIDGVTQDNSNQILGTNAGDVLTGNNEDNSISALGGNDTVVGLLGDDDIKGGDGDDSLRGDDGSRGDGTGKPGGNDVIFGENGDDGLDGRSGNDVLSGGSGNDDIKGGDGDDILIGGSGNDLLRGDVRNVRRSNRGNDTFVLAEGEGTDTIFDFQDGIDKIALQGNLTFDELTISQSRRNTLVGITDTGEQLAILKGFKANRLNADDFTEGFANINNTDDARVLI